MKLDGMTWMADDDWMLFSERGVGWSCSDKRCDFCDICTAILTNGISVEADKAHPQHKLEVLCNRNLARAVHEPSTLKTR